MDMRMRGQECSLNLLTKIDSAKDYVIDLQANTFHVEKIKLFRRET